QSGNQLTGPVSLSNSGAASITLVNAPGLNLSQAVAGSGGLSVQAGGSLTVGQTLGTGMAISTSGALTLATTAGDLALEQAIQSTAGGTTLNSAGAINMAAGVLLNAGSGLLTLAASGDIDVAALQTSSSAPNAVNLSSQSGQVAAAGHGSVNVTATGGLNIQAANGIGAGNPLQVSVGSITAENSLTGDIDIASLQATALLTATQGSGGNITVTSSGTMTVGTLATTTSPAVSTAGSGGITLSTSGSGANLILDQGVQAAGGTIGLTAGGVLTFSTTVASTTGEINAAGTTIAMAASSAVVSASGAIALDAARDVVVSSLATGSTVSVTSDTRSIAVVGPPSGVNITAGGAALSAATGIGTAAPITTAVGTLAASNSTNNGIYASNVSPGLFTIGTVGVQQGIQLSGAAPAAIVVSSAGPMQVAGNVLNTTGGNIVLTSGGTNNLLTVGRIQSSGGNGDVTLNSGGNLLLDDAVNQAISNPLLWTPDIQVSGSGTITGNAGGQVQIGSNVLIRSGTGSVTQTPPLLANVITPEIDSNGVATVIANVGRPGESDFTVTINWHDGTTTTLQESTPGVIDVAHRYLVNPDLANGAAPIPMTVTLTGDPNISFSGRTVLTVTAPISGTGLFLSYQGLTAPVQVPIFVLPRLDEPIKPIVEVVPVEGFVEVQQPRVQSGPSEERVVTMNLVPPGGGTPVPFQLPENVTDNLPALFKRLPDGHYQIFVDEPGRQPRMLIDVFLRQGRPVDPDDKSEGTEDRPPTAMFESAPADIFVSQALPAARAESRQSAAAERADRALAASLQSRTPVAAMLAASRRGTAPVDRHAASAGSWESAATVGAAALAGIVVLRPAGGQQSEHERAELADRTMGRMSSQPLDRAARWSRRVRQHLPAWTRFLGSDSRSQ
ncbi:MAG TPA: hypothetical protein VIK18_21835, partial [Pirellulales bacterium]